MCSHLLNLVESAFHIPFLGEANNGTQIPNIRRAYAVNGFRSINLVNRLGRKSSISWFLSIERTRHGKDK